jgi:hypothetical protein
MIDWSKTDVVIPSVVSIPERLANLPRLIWDLALQCPDVRIITVPQVKPKGTNPRGAFEAIVRGLHGVRGPWVFYIEDDVRLSSRFGELAAAALDKVDEECGAVSFYSRAAKYMQRLSHAPSVFCYAQCIAMRVHVAVEWRGMLLDWWDAAPAGLKRAPDMALGDCCRQLGFSIFVHHPSLVQHIGAPSAFGHNGEHTSPTFGEELQNS